MRLLQGETQMNMQDVKEKFALKCNGEELNVPIKDGSIDILECTLYDSKFLNRLAGATKGVTFENPKNALWWLGFIGNNLVGSVCLTMLGSKARCKSDFVLSSMRGRGIYSVLFNKRLKHIEDRFIPQATCFSTQFSRPMFAKAGFKIEKGLPEDDIVFMSKIM
jgi:hypothetical protein